MITNYPIDRCISDVLNAPIPRTNSGLRLPRSLDDRNVLMPPSAEEAHALGDAYGGVTELSDTQNDLVHVRNGKYVSRVKGGLFRRAVKKRIVGGAGPVFGHKEGDVIYAVPR